MAITIKITGAISRALLANLHGTPQRSTERLVREIRKVSDSVPLSVAGRPTSHAKGAFPFRRAAGTDGYFRRHELHQLYRWLLVAHAFSSGSVKGQLKKAVNKICDLLQIDVVTRMADIGAVLEMQKARKKQQAERPTKGPGESRPSRQSCSPHCLPALGAHSASCRARQARASGA